MKQKSCFKFLPWPGFEPRTLQSDGHEHHHWTKAHPLVLGVVLDRLPKTCPCFHNCKLEISTAPTKSRSRKPAVSQVLNQNKIDSQRSRSRVRQADSYNGG